MKISIIVNFIMAWKHECIFLKYHLNISEILQGVVHVNNIWELFLKHFYTYKTWIEI